MTADHSSEEGGEGLVRARLDDLTRRLGFGPGYQEPQADNDTIVAWFEQQSRDASEWQESQLWRNDCYAAGHPDDEDCPEHDPVLRLHNAEVERDDLRGRLAAVEALADEWDAYSATDEWHAADCWHAAPDILRAALANPSAAQGEGEAAARVLREAADARPHWMSPTVSKWLHQRAERLLDDLAASAPEADR